MSPEQTQARVNRWGQPEASLGQGESEGMGHQEGAQGQEGQAEGQRREEGRAGSTETRALATRPGPLWLGKVVSGPLICLEARQALTSKGCLRHQAGQAHLSRPRTPGSFPGRSL